MKYINIKLTDQEFDFLISSLQMLERVTGATLDTIMEKGVRNIRQEVEREYNRDLMDARRRILAGEKVVNSREVYK